MRPFRKGPHSCEPPTPPAQPGPKRHGVWVRELGSLMAPFSEGRQTPYTPGLVLPTYANRGRLADDGDLQRPSDP